MHYLPTVTNHISNPLSFVHPICINSLISFVLELVSHLLRVKQLKKQRSVIFHVDRPSVENAFELVYHFVIKTLRPRQNGRHFSDDILKCIFLNENVWLMSCYGYRCYMPYCTGTNMTIFHWNQIVIGICNGLVLTVMSISTDDLILTSFFYFDLLQLLIRQMLCDVSISKMPSINAFLMPSINRISSPACVLTLQGSKICLIAWD